MRTIAQFHRSIIFLCAASHQSGCFDPLGQSFLTQQPTVSPVPLDTKLPSYPSQFTPASQAQLPPELAAGGPQGQGFGAPRAAFPGGATGVGSRPGAMRPQGPQLRLSPNQLRLQLQQRLQGPQQVRPVLGDTFRTVHLSLKLLRICVHPLYPSAPEQGGGRQSVSRSSSAREHRGSSGSSTTSTAHTSE